jgi:hypothetical protein
MINHGERRRNAEFGLLIAELNQRSAISIQQFFAFSLSRFSFRQT